jgi:hypothetical protein
VPKGQTRLEGFDDRIISLYARGLSVREIQAHLQELYDVQFSPDLVSRVTDAVLEEVREWQSRPLDPVYPVIFFDALRVKIRDEGLVRNKGECSKTTDLAVHHGLRRCRLRGISGRRRHRSTAPSGTPDYHVEPTRPTDLAWRGDTPAGARRLAPAHARVPRRRGGCGLAFRPRCGLSACGADDRR